MRSETLSELIDRVGTEQLFGTARAMAEARRNLLDNLDNPIVDDEQREVMQSEANRIGDERGKIIDEIKRRQASAK